MRTLSLGLCLCNGLLLTPALAAETEAPSIELLLYLADWEADRAGQLIDPLDVPEDDQPAPQVAPPEPNSPTASTPEYPR